MTDDQPVIRLKIDLIHDDRNHDAHVGDVEDRLEQHLNHNDAVPGRAQNVRISVGRAAGAVFVRLTPRKWAPDKLERITRIVADRLGAERYADNVTVECWTMEARKPEQ